MQYQQQRCSSGDSSSSGGAHNSARTGRERKLQMGQRRSVDAWDDTWRIEMKCAFPGPRQLRIAVLVRLKVRAKDRVLYITLYIK